MKKIKLLQDSQPSLKKSEWFGSCFSFSSEFKYKYETNIFEKDLSTQKLQTVHLSVLDKQRLKASSQIELCEKLGEKVEVVNSQVKQFNAFLKEKQTEEFFMNRAATKIQKIIRGYLTRKHIEQSLIGVRRVKICEEIEGILKDKRFYMYGVGRLPKISATLIQRAYRRHKFREKIEWLWVAYNQYMSTKEENNYMILKRRVKSLVCIQKLKWLKFETHKAMRLKQIREKWAITKIKSILKFLKIRPKHILSKIKKYKRLKRFIHKKKMRKLQQMLENYEGDLALIKNDPKYDIDNISIDSTEEIGTTTSDREALEREKEMRKMEEQRKTRIFLAKISYNCQSVKTRKLSTLINNKLVPEPEKIPELPKIVRKSPPKGKIRGKLNLDDPSYLKSTLNFDYKLKKLKEKKTNNYYKQKLVFNFGHLLEPTKSFMLKTKERSLSNDRSPEDLQRHFNKRNSLQPDEGRSPPAKLFKKLSPLQ